MPIYEYTCDACGHYLEALQKFSDKPLVDCPDCGEKKLKKLISAAGFRLKGSGWYETDFKGNGKGKSADVKEAKKQENETGQKPPECGAAACGARPAAE